MPLVGVSTSITTSAPLQENEDALDNKISEIVHKKTLDVVDKKT